MAPALRDLLAEPSLALSALTGELGLDRALDDVRTVELPGEAGSLRPGTLAISTGLWAGRRLERQRELASSLSPAAALVFRRGVAVPNVPDALIGNCLEFGVPVLAAPAATRPEDVASELARRSPSPGADALLLALAGELAAEDGRRRLIERAAAITGAATALFAPWGNLVAWAGNAPLATLWDALHRPGDLEWLGPTPAGLALSLPVRSGGRTRWVLAGVAPDLEALARLRPALEVARRLLALEGPTAAGRDPEPDIRAALLDELLREPYRPELHDARLSGAGLEPGEPLALAVAEVQDHWARYRASRPSEVELLSLLDGLRHAGRRFLHDTGLPVLDARRGSRALFAWVTTDPAGQAEGLRRALAAAAPQADVRTGISDPVAGPAMLAGAQRQALAAARSVREPHGLRLFRLLEPLDWVAATGPQDELRALVDRTLGTVRREDSTGKLEATLRTYLALDRSPSRAAERLGVHQNTLRYRLGRIEAALGTSLDAGATIASLHLALAADDRLDPRG